MLSVLMSCTYLSTLTGRIRFSARPVTTSSTCKPIHATLHGLNKLHDRRRCGHGPRVPHRTASTAWSPAAVTVPGRGSACHAETGTMVRQPGTWPFHGGDVDLSVNHATVPSPALTDRAVRSTAAALLIAERWISKPTRPSTTTSTLVCPAVTTSKSATWPARSAALA